ncbi:MAG TPA: type II toxin-antitoxin system VapC family toxin [Thermoflexia bacterium]|nr:type II toxin-antitoxin system VapC family toxin [Thermoflexia bacterium]
MPDYLIDTNVLIEHLRGKPEVVDFLIALEERGSLYFSVLSEAEVYVGMQEDEREQTEALFDALFGLPVTREVAQLGGGYRQRYRHEGVGLIDALIAATAVLGDLVLVTYNHRHFPMPNLWVVCPPIRERAAYAVRGEEDILPASD